MPPPDMMPKRPSLPGAPTIEHCQWQLLHPTDRRPLLQVRCIRTPFSRARPPHHGCQQVISIQNDRWAIISPKCLPGIPTHRGHARAQATRGHPRPRPVTVTSARRLRLAPALHSHGRLQERPYMRRTPLLSTLRSTHNPHKPRNIIRAPRRI